MKTLNSNPTGQVTGYLCLWKLPDVGIKYTDLAAHAAGCGFPEKHVPASPKKRGAWERATNLGAKGLVVEAPVKLAAEIQAKHGVKPTVRLKTEIISRKAPNLIRHIVRYVTVPMVDKKANKRRLAELQLDAQTVCIMEFNTETNVMKSTSYDQLSDQKGWVNGNLAKQVKQMENLVDKALNWAGGNDIRHGIREWLLSKNATLQSSGGAYFLPYRPGLADELQSVKCYLEGLTPQVVKQHKDPKTGKMVPADKPQFTIFPVVDDGSDVIAETKATLTANAIDSFKADLEDLSATLNPVLNGKRTENVSDKLKAAATIRFMEINQNIAQYKQVLGDQMQELGFYLEMMTNQIKAANEVTEFRAPVSRTDKADDDE